MSSIRKYQILAAFFAGVAFIGLAFAGVTGFGSIKLVDSPGLIKDSGGTTRLSLATTGTNLSITGTVGISTLTISGTQGFILGAVVSTGTATPSAAGTLVRTSNNEIYVSSGTGQGAWLKVGAQ